MQGNFKYHNPTKLYFGEESLNYLRLTKIAKNK
jgi:alcohol dehydrogenase YqhD (iron-dependent ADH family)